MKWIDRHYWPVMRVIIALMMLGMAVIIVLQIGLDLGWFE
jgi:hypothetical protein